PHRRIALASRRRDGVGFLVEPEAHADQPVPRGVGVDEGDEGLVALPGALGLPGANRAAWLEAGDDAPGGQRPKRLRTAPAREMDGAWAGLGELQAGVDRVLHRIHADDE